eukprot:Sspe_Gene.80151::Locus_50455_Transcript_1_1_Confidence_1.000_Length_866::g.80151::m.80151
MGFAGGPPGGTPRESSPDHTAHHNERLPAKQSCERSESVSRSIVDIDLARYVKPVRYQPLNLLAGEKELESERAEASTLPFESAELEDLAAEGERLRLSDKWSDAGSDRGYPGRLVYTTYRIAFCPEESTGHVISIPWGSLLHMSCCENSSKLILSTTLGSTLHINLLGSATSVYTLMLLRGERPPRTPKEPHGPFENPYHLYAPKEEFKRIGVVESGWMLVENHEYKICPTYPRWLWVPSATDNDEDGARGWAEKAAAYRKQNRLPVL